MASTGGGFGLWWWVGDIFGGKADRGRAAISLHGRKEEKGWQLQWEQVSKIDFNPPPLQLLRLDQAFAFLSLEIGGSWRVKPALVWGFFFYYYLIYFQALVVSGAWPTVQPHKVMPQHSSHDLQCRNWSFLFCHWKQHVTILYPQLPLSPWAMNALQSTEGVAKD